MLSLKEGNDKLCFMTACWLVTSFFIEITSPSTLHCINRVLGTCDLSGLTWDHTHSSPAHGPHCSSARGLQSLLDLWCWHPCAQPHPALQTGLPKKRQTYAVGSLIASLVSDSVSWIILVATLQAAPPLVGSTTVSDWTLLDISQTSCTSINGASHCHQVPQPWALGKEGLAWPVLASPLVTAHHPHVG